MSISLSADLVGNPLLIVRAVFWGRPREGDVAFNMAVRIRFGIVPLQDDDPHDGVIAILHVAQSPVEAEKLYSVLSAKSNLNVARAYLVDVSARAGHVLSSASIDAPLARGDSLMAVFDLSVSNE